MDPSYQGYRYYRTFPGIIILFVTNHRIKDRIIDMKEIFSIFLIVSLVAPCKR